MTQRPILLPLLLLSVCNLVGCEDKSHCWQDESVCIQIHATDPTEEYTILELIEITVTYQGNSSSRWNGNQEQDAGECSRTWTNHPESGKQINISQCCTKQSETGRFDVQVNREGQVLLEKSVTVRLDPQQSCNVETQVLFLEVGP